MDLLAQTSGSLIIPTVPNTNQDATAGGTTVDWEITNAVHCAFTSLSEPVC